MLETVLLPPMSHSHAALVYQSRLLKSNTVQPGSLVGSLSYKPNQNLPFEDTWDANEAYKTYMWSGVYVGNNIVTFSQAHWFTRGFPIEQLSLVFGGISELSTSRNKTHLFYVCCIQFCDLITHMILRGPHPFVRVLCQILSHQFGYNAHTHSEYHQW